MISMSNKKGAEMSINTIILIIIGVAVLAVLILGFTMGWKTLAPSLGSTNVKAIESACDTKCSLNSRYDFCSADLSEPLEDEKGNEIKTTCYALANIKFFEIYGIKKCTNINCQPKKECELISITINGETYDGVEKDKCDSEKDIEISDIANGLSSTSTFGRHCCLLDAKTNIKE